MTNVDLTGKLMTQFIGREKELQRLNGILNQGFARMVLMKGRRRIGKSRLLTEFGKAIGTTHIFTGLAPTKGITPKHQRDEFARQLGVEFGLRGIKTNDWGDLFWHLSDKTQKGRVLIVLDEISWMASGDPTFLPKLKAAWDLYFTKNPKLILALCSSISMWLDDNIVSNTGFLGRESLTMTLDQLPLNDCKKFWNSQSQISAQEKLLMLSVTGGVPRYLEEIKPNQTAQHNIKELCFTKEGILFNEFEKIFSDLFDDKKDLYRNIITTLVAGPSEAKNIFEKNKLIGSGEDYKILENLTKAGFITQDITWQIKKGISSKLTKYRLSDNYCRFYLKYIKPNKHKILLDNYSELNLTSLPAWTSIIGLQVENLILNNRHLIKQALNINPSEIVFDNPYFQRQTNRQKGCQIDYMIQTQFNTLYVCEIKYSKKIINSEVIDKVKEKISRLSIPKNFSIRPVLIHCHEVSEAVEESGFFSTIINFAEFL